MNNVQSIEIAKLKQNLKQLQELSERVKALLEQLKKDVGKN